MSLVKKVITRIKIEIARRIGPILVDRYVSKSGERLPHVVWVYYLRPVQKTWNWVIISTSLSTVL